MGFKVLNFKSEECTILININAFEIICKKDYGSYILQHNYLFIILNIFILLYTKKSMNKNLTEGIIKKILFINFILYNLLLKPHKKKKQFI